MHSIGMTQRYLILAESPLVVDPLRLKFSGRPFIQNYEWTKNRGVRFHVIEKDSGRVAGSAEAEPCFAFHHVNAFEENQQVVVDLGLFGCRCHRSAVPQPFAVIKTGNRDGQTDPFSRGSEWKRWHQEARRHRNPIELPRIDYRRSAGRPDRVAYGVGNHGSGERV
jgi:beta,beta-carotene 9',10'-dioxygenase